MVKRLLEDKRAAFLLSLLGVLALALLAGALNNMTFRPMQPLTRSADTGVIAQVPVRKIVNDILEMPLWKLISFFMGALAISILAISMLSPETRKRLLRMLLRMVVSVIAIYYLFKTNPDLLQGVLAQLNFDNQPAPNLPEAGNTAPPVFQPPQVSPSFSFFVTLVIIVVMAVILWRIYVWWQAQNEHRSNHPLMEIAKVARASLHELSQGASQDAIIRCYEKMSDAVFTRRGLQRNYAMTAAEFARQLENAGLPREPVQRLTRLFESARYSSRTSTQSDIDEAIACLTSILQYCGQTA